MHRGVSRQYLNGEAVLATVDVDQLQARHVARLTIGLAVQQQAQPMGFLQVRFNPHINGEGAVVGAKGFVRGQAGQLQCRVRAGVLGARGCLHGGG
ncbi:hypothetical protein D3C75_1014530 [compost metagenome]